VSAKGKACLELGISRHDLVKNQFDRRDQSRGTTRPKAGKKDLMTTTLLLRDGKEKKKEVEAASLREEKSLGN